VAAFISYRTIYVYISSYTIEIGEKFIGGNLWIYVGLKSFNEPTPPWGIYPVLVIGDYKQAVSPMLT
jgi:hypothetical protein